MDDAVITVVTGMPRCGSSMMMEMLSAGGIPPYTDNRSRRRGRTVKATRCGEPRSDPAAPSSQESAP